MKERELTIEYRALTPIHTGNPEGKVDRLHETGFLGSMRWWFEAMVRGMGGYAPDPVGGPRSNFDIEAYEAQDERRQLDEKAFQYTQRLRDAGLDDASQVFGATGWRRRFRLDLIAADNFHRAALPERIVLHDRINPNKGEPATWYPSENRPFEDRFEARLISLDRSFPIEIAGGILWFMSMRAAVGAKNQMGMGVIEQSGGDEIDRYPLFKWLDDLPGISRSQAQSMEELPALNNIFLAEIRAPGTAIEEAYRLKYDLRQLFDDRDVRHFFMGTAGRERIAAKIKMSLPYGDPPVMRVWGWLPHQHAHYSGHWNRDKILDAVHGHLAGIDPGVAWTEFDSTRDSKSPRDMPDFLRSLLSLPTAS